MSKKAYCLKIACKDAGVEYISAPIERTEEELELVKEGIKLCHKNRAESFELVTSTGFIMIPGVILAKSVFEIIEMK